MKWFLILAWALLLLFWLILCFAQPLMGDPIPYGATEKYARVNFSEWRSTPDKSRSGQQIYERSGVLSQDLWIISLVERKDGKEGEPNRVRDDVTINPMRTGIAIASTIAPLGLVTLVWVKRNRQRRLSQSEDIGS
jgi:hypothetical protein